MQAFLSKKGGISEDALDAFAQTLMYEPSMDTSDHANDPTAPFEYIFDSPLPWYLKSSWIMKTLLSMDPNSDWQRAGRQAHRPFILAAEGTYTCSDCHAQLCKWCQCGKAFLVDTTTGNGINESEVTNCLCLKCKASKILFQDEWQDSISPAYAMPQYL